MRWRAPPPGQGPFIPYAALGPPRGHPGATWRRAEPRPTRLWRKAVHYPMHSTGRSPIVCARTMCPGRLDPALDVRLACGAVSSLPAWHKASPARKQCTTSPLVAWDMGKSFHSQLSLGQ
eukprot:scaffold885_cov381-Prasinococcus_capsulatus_cf.AAC.9